MKPVSEWDLSEKQTQIIQRLVEGETQKQVAAALCMSVRTVECHMQRLYTKAGFPRCDLHTGARVKVLIAYDRHVRGDVCK